jgi:hypothetical protein
MTAEVEYHNKLSHTWVVTLDVPGQWPDQRKRYGSIVYRPTRLSFSAHSFDGGKLKFVGASISGPRINKGGLGVVVADVHYYNPMDLPEWALKLVEGFMATV